MPASRTFHESSRLSRKEFFATYCVVKERRTSTYLQVPSKSIHVVIVKKFPYLEITTVTISFAASAADVVLPCSTIISLWYSGVLYCGTCAESCSHNTSDAQCTLGASVASACVCNQWPVSEINITCDSVTSFGGQIMEKTVRF